MEIDVAFRRILFVISLLSMAFAGQVQAVSLYKWVDENGSVHYSQKPPEKSATKSEQMQVKDSNPYQTRQEKAATAEKKKEDQPETTDEAARVVEARKKNCEIARQNMATFQNSARVKQSDGTIITLSEEMRAAKIKETQALINAYCN
jgi:hypothetical protein